METPRRLCLCMIVKNESRVIARALQSVRPIIDYWVICDTGSTDNTQALVLNTLFDIPGELHQVDWVNFGHNRTQAVQLARGKSDYILVLDADMVANVHGDFKQKLSADSYLIRYEGNIDYSQPMLLANRHDWAYVGVTHEYVHAVTASRTEPLHELTLTHFGDGGMRSDKFERDIRLLLEAVQKEPDNSRAVFYLAQSYKDVDNHANALQWYRRRLELEGWDEEIWYARYQTARMTQLSGAPWSEVLPLYLEAYRLRPQRLEPLYPVVRHYREAEDFALGYLYASVIEAGWPYPVDDMLFLEKNVYDYLLPLEHGVCAYSTGRISEAIRAFNRVLLCEQLPGWVADSAVRGRNMCLDLLYAPVAPAATEPNRIKVLVPFYNPGSFLERCVASLLEQDYPHFEIIFCDDASTDGSAEKIPLHDPRVRLLRRSQRLGAAANLHDLLLEHCAPDDIAVLVDGDDWLACADALSAIDRSYREQHCWVLYGQFRYSTGEYGISQPYASPDDFRALRSRWLVSHLKTFRAGLYRRIADQDPDYRCLKTSEGQWLQRAVDAAMMFPLLEMAGFDRVRYQEKICYVYNFENPQSHYATNPEAQAAAFKDLQTRRPFGRISNYQ